MKMGKRLIEMVKMRENSRLFFMKRQKKDF